MRLNSFIPLFFTLFFGSNSVLYAEAKQHPISETIPFITYKQSSQPLSSSTPAISTTGASSHNSCSDNNPSVDNIPTENLENLLIKIRSTVCRSAGNADIRVWINFDVSGKVLGIGAAAQSGLEVTFHCKGK